MDEMSWWVRVEGSQFLRYEIAGRRVPGDWSAWASALLGVGPTDDWIDYLDISAGTYRAAHLHEDRLESCAFVSPRPELPSRSWLATLFEKTRITPAERMNLLAGRPADPTSDTGAVVCACFNVGRNAIDAAIAQGCNDVGDIGKRLKAGTNCGSCIPELRRIAALNSAAV